MNIELTNKDQQVGLDIIKKSLVVPIKQVTIDSDMYSDLTVKGHWKL